MTEEKNTWRFSESRPIRPFKISEHALVSTGFRTRDDIDFSTQNPWHLTVEPEEIENETFHPSFDLTVDRDSLSSETGIGLCDLDLSLIVTSPASHISECFEKWRIEDFPDQYSMNYQALRNLSCRRGYRFSLIVSPNRPLDTAFRTASSPGQVVASRTFDVTITESGSGFPVELADLPKETVWVIQWLTESDFDRPVEDVLCVYLNREEGEKILRLSNRDAVGNAFWREIATEVFVEICLNLFKKETDPPLDPDGLLYKMTHKLSTESGLDFDGLISKSEDGTKGAGFFRAHLQKGLELGDRIKKINLAGRAQ